MPVEVKRKSEYRSYVNYTERCSTGKHSTEVWKYNELSTEHVKSYFTSTPRIKPALPFLDPTDYPYVYNDRYAIGIEEEEFKYDLNGWVQHPYPEWVNGYSHTNTRKRRLLPPGNSWINEVPSTIWPLKASLAIKDKTVNLGESLAELGQTASQLSEAINYCIGAVRRLRKGKLPVLVGNSRERRKILKELRRLPRKQRKALTLDSIPAAWLGTRFGVVPLIADTHKTYTALRLKASRGIFQKVYVKDKQSASGSISHEGSERTTSGSASNEYRANIWITLDVSTPIDFGNPLELAWELTPGSLVADWIFNVGDVLSGLDALKHVKSLTGTVTQKTRQEARLSGKYRGYSSTTPSSYQKKSFQRTVVTKSMLNYGLWSSLRYSPSDNILNVVDGLAILRQYRR